MEAVGAVRSGGVGGFGHALEACKNFLSTAVSGRGGIGGEAVGAVTLVWAEGVWVWGRCGHALEACQGSLKE